MDHQNKDLAIINICEEYNTLQERVFDFHKYLNTIDEVQFKYSHETNTYLRKTLKKIKVIKSLSCTLYKETVSSYKKEVALLQEKNNSLNKELQHMYHLQNLQQQQNGSLQN